MVTHIARAILYKTDHYLVALGPNCAYCWRTLDGNREPQRAEEVHSIKPVMSASLIGRSVSSAFRLSIAAVLVSLTGSCFSSESAQGPSIMGIENEAEQSIGRPCRLADGRSKRTCDLTSSIVP